MSLDLLPVVPSNSSRPKNTARVLRNDFGEGYGQRGADGINNIDTTWDMKFEVITSTQADTLEAFFISKGGYIAFLWLPPKKTGTWKWTCKEWDRDPDVCGLTNMTGTFKREFDL